jgi:hypothetical protein
MSDWQAIYHRFWARAIQGGSVALHKRTQITIETDQVLIIRRQRAGRAWCRVCQEEVDVVRTEQTRGLVQSFPDSTSVRTQGLHLCEGSDGCALVCLNSLLRSSDGQ